MHRRTAYGLLALLVLVEWAVFSQFYHREVMPSFPRMYHQAAYLGRALDVYELWHRRGFLAGLRESLTWTWPQGLLLPHEAALAFFFLGPTRLTAVAVNFAHLVLLQSLIVWLGVRAQRPLTGLALCGVLLSAGATRAELGGLPDFRLDFAGYAFLTAIGLAVAASGGFRLRRPSVAVGVLGGVACLTRTILFPYLVAGLAGWGLVALCYRRRPGARARIGNAFIAAGLTAMVMLPALIAQFRALANYYVGGHVTSGEGAVRAPELGLFTQWDHLTFYVRSAAADQTGRLFAAVLVALLGLVWWRWRSANAAAEEPAAQTPLLERDAWWAGLFVASVGLGAFLILTVNVAKSPVVGNIFAGLAVAFLWTIVGTVCPDSGPAWERPRWFAGGLLAIFLVGSLAFVVRWTRPSIVQPTFSGQDIGAFLETVDFIAEASEMLGARAPKISYDEVTEFFQNDVIRVLAFERHGTLLTPRAGLGAIRIALSALDKPAAIADLERSDFALLGADRPLEAPPGAYPVNRSLQAMSGDLLAWASANMARVRDVSFFGRRVTLFVSASIACDGQQDQWITAAGLRCRTLGAALRQRPLFEFEGGANAEYLGGDPQVRIRVDRRRARPAEFACTYERRPGPGFQPYVVRCPVCPTDLGDAEPIEVTVIFDRSFVPRHIGLNEDPRALVVQWPGRLGLNPGSCEPSPRQEPAAPR